MQTCRQRMLIATCGVTGVIQWLFVGFTIVSNMPKSYALQCLSMATYLIKLPFPVRNLDPIQYIVPWAHPSLHYCFFWLTEYIQCCPCVCWHISKNTRPNLFSTHVACGRVLVLLSSGIADCAELIIIITTSAGWPQPSVWFGLSFNAPPDTV